MTGTLPLILSQEPVTRGLMARMKESRPNLAVVYADAFGHIAYFGGRPLKWSEQFASRYRVRYEVDLSDHRRTARLDSSPLPSRGDAYFFHSMVDVGFRVTDPAAVVRRNVTDGLTVVYNYLIDAFRPITRGYDIRDATGAENEINMRFQYEVTLEEGITIYHCRARLLPDEAAKGYLRSLEGASRSLTVGEAEHKVAMATTQYSQALAEVEQIGRLESEKRELAYLREPVNLHGLIRTHLAKHPDDTMTAMQLLASYEQARLDQRGTEGERWLELVKFMTDHEVIQAVDMQMLRTEMLGKVHEIAAPAPNRFDPDAGAAWDTPLPMLSLAAEPSGPAAAPAPAAPAAPAQTPSVAPVYLIIDESVGDEAYFRALDDGLQDLPATLAGEPEVLAAVRLAILGYARDVAARMRVNAVTADTMLPQLTPRPGASLAAVFAYLYSQLPRDMDRLKSRHPRGVVRPTAYLLCATAPDAEQDWGTGLAQILDRTEFRYAPNIVACGAGAMPAEALEVIAAQPGCHAFAADPGIPLHEAAGQYAAFVQRELATQVHALISGRRDVHIAAPQGFHAVQGLV